MRIYESLSSYNPLSQDSFKLAYRDLMEEQRTQAAYRGEIVHFYYWTGFIGLAPPSKEMRKGMTELFHYLRYGKDPLLIKSCLCHYAIQFYQPFQRENEKMSRLWQTLLLMKEHPSFEFLPWEKEILNEKKRYYSRLPDRDQNTDTSEFVKYMLRIINIALSNLLESCRKTVRPMDRIQYFYTLELSSFTRKDYMRVHKNISTATASRDLDLGVETGFFKKRGIYNQSTYQCYRL
jgi:Fic family protein